MGILINDLNMPTERESFNLTIKYNGLVFDTETGMQVAEAHELPPHGRLIDADAIRRLLVHSLLNPDVTSPTIRGLMKTIISAIDSFPTIIPAEEGET